jgi:hypothetical protein
MKYFGEVTYKILDLMSVVFVLGIVVVIVTIGAFFVVDVSQSKDAVRRNFPVLGRFRRVFSTLGEFFRNGPRGDAI